ncbi:MAG TPA: hypothetical protein VFD41_10820 [Actinomycetales bacterium]|nr:hypothetical protein [Actinomycetales bacterium]
MNHTSIDYVPRSITMNLLNEHLARAQCPPSERALERARMVRALRAQRRAERLERKAANAQRRAAREWVEAVC